MRPIRLNRRAVLAGLGMAAALGPRATYSAPAAKAGAAASTPAAGPLLLAGGGQGRADMFWRRLVALAGGAGATIMIVPSAAARPAEAAAAAAAKLTALGAKPVVIPLPGGRAQDLIEVGRETNPFGPEGILRDDKVWPLRFAEAKGILFLDGDRVDLATGVYYNNIEVTALLKAIRAAHDAGAVVAGIGAGAALMSANAFRVQRPLGAIARSSLQWETDLYTGFGLLPEPWVVASGPESDDALARLALATLRKPIRFGIGLSNDALLVVDAESLAVESGAVLALVGETAPTFGAQRLDYRLSRLHAGDRMARDGAVKLRQGIAPTARGKDARTLVVPTLDAPGAIDDALSQIALGNAASAQLLLADWGASAAKPARLRLFTLGWDQRAHVVTDSDGRLSIDGMPMRFEPYRTLAFPLVAPVQASSTVSQ